MSNRKLRCVIIRMPADSQNMDDIRMQQIDMEHIEMEQIDLNAGDFARESRAEWPGREPRGERPSVKDLLPWADPYILKLIDRCQKEVAADVAQKRSDWADRRGFLENWGMDQKDIDTELEDDFREARDAFSQASDAFEGHPFGFEWDGEEFDGSEDDDFQPHEAYLRPVRKSK